MTSDLKIIHIDKHCAIEWRVILQYCAICIADRLSRQVFNVTREYYT